MNYLLDTHLLLWAAEGSPNLPNTIKEIINDKNNTLYFSAASLWEISVKNGLAKGFYVDGKMLRRGLLENGYHEIHITSEHAITVESLPPIHKDPFDRILIAQAIHEGIYFVTVDQMIKAYGLSNILHF